MQVTPINDDQLLKGMNPPQEFDNVASGMTDKQKHAYNAQYFGQGDGGDPLAAAQSPPSNENPLA